jgi:hypothetical protein
MKYKEIPIYDRYSLEPVATLMFCVEECGTATDSPGYRIAVFGGSPHVVEGKILTADFEDLLDELGE